MASGSLNLIYKVVNIISQEKIDLLYEIFFIYRLFITPLFYFSVIHVAFFQLILTCCKKNYSQLPPVTVVDISSCGTCS